MRTTNMTSRIMTSKFHRCRALSKFIDMNLLSALSQIVRGQLKRRRGGDRLMTRGLGDFLGRHKRPWVGSSS